VKEQNSKVFISAKNSEVPIELKFPVSILHQGSTACTQMFISTKLTFIAWMLIFTQPHINYKPP